MFNIGDKIFKRDQKNHIVSGVVYKIVNRNYYIKGRKKNYRIEFNRACKYIDKNNNFSINFF
jgi:hypothetical protein